MNREARVVRRVNWFRTLIAKKSATLGREHLQHWPEKHERGPLHCFLVDCSGSMLRGQHLARAKGLLLQLIQAAYRQRAHIAIVAFGGNTAWVHVPPARARPISSQQVGAWLQPIGGGGGTPLLKGVGAASRLLMARARLHPGQARWLWLLTDGRSTDSPRRPATADVAVIVDCECSRAPLQRCRCLADDWRAHLWRLSDCSPDLSWEPA